MIRREFAKTALAASGFGLAGCCAKSVQKTEEKKPYGVQYYEKAKEIWDRESSTELPIIIEAADKAAHSLISGRKLFSNVIFGHMLIAEFRPNRAGNPNYLPNWDRYATDDQYEAIGEGDFLLFDYAHPRVKAARDRGAYTVGICVPYLPNKTTPSGVLFSNYSLFSGMSTDECSSAVLTSGVPFTDGALFIPEIPAVRACPLSVQGAGIFYWMLIAEIAMRDKHTGSTGTGEKALEYVDCIKERGRRISNDIGRINEAAKLMTDRVANGGSYWNYSFGCEFDIENYIRASGIAMSQLIRPDTVNEKVKPGDFAIVSGEFSDIHENIVMARALKNKGAAVISIGPAHTEGSGGEDLSAIADVNIETYSPEREGVVSVPGFDRKLCPATGNLFALAQWMLNAQFIERMIEADMVPGLDMGVHLIGGRGHNSSVRKIVKERGY
ncbi:hypothetical protein ACFL60_03220 [Candidatus Omnitrophota bacterium]